MYHEQRIVPMNSRSLMRHHTDLPIQVMCQRGQLIVQGDVGHVKVNDLLRCQLFVPRDPVKRKIIDGRVITSSRWPHHWIDKGIDVTLDLSELEVSKKSVEIIRMVPRPKLNLKTYFRRWQVSLRWLRCKRPPAGRRQ